MLAEIITIGDEILIGQVVDTNSAWLATHLNDVGIQVHQITSLPDNANHITQGLDEALAHADVVLITGGLGPTRDDITKHTLAAYFGMKLTLHQPSYDFIGRMLAKRGIDFNVSNQGQAMLPEGCTVLPNRNGTAPGMWFERGSKIVVSMPGVPFEMTAMMEEEVLPRMKAHFQLNAIVHKTAVTYGMAESTLAETIAGWEDRLAPHLRLAYLPGPAGIRLRLSAYEVNRGEAQEEIERQFEELERIIPEYIVGYDDATIESAVGGILVQRGQTVAVAESCTGGAIASRFTSRAGASDYFTGGVVAYSNDLKTTLLGVKPETLKQCGAVSRETAVEMAEGMRRISGATYAIATTGIAGPDGGTPEKPVGTVWIAIATPEGMFTRLRMFGALREVNIQRASSTAINLLRLYLTGAAAATINTSI